MTTHPTPDVQAVLESREPIHEWFGLSYANYLVLNRSLLQSMPLEWQDRFVACLEELDGLFGGYEMPDRYEVRCKMTGVRHAVPDPIPHYDRGRTRVPPRISRDA